MWSEIFKKSFSDTGFESTVVWIDLLCVCRIKLLNHCPCVYVSWWAIEYLWPIVICWSHLTHGQLLRSKVMMINESSGFPKAFRSGVVLIWLKGTTPGRWSAAWEAHADAHIRHMHTHVIISESLKADHTLKLTYVPFNQCMDVIKWSEKTWLLLRITPFYWAWWLMHEVFTTATQTNTHTQREP